MKVKVKGSILGEVLHIFRSPMITTCGKLIPLDRQTEEEEIALEDKRLCGYCKRQFLHSIEIIRRAGLEVVEKEECHV